MTYNELSVALIDYYPDVTNSLIFKVSDISYATAIKDDSYVVNIAAHFIADGSFLDAKGYSWKYAVPVLPNGTPLRIVNKDNHAL